MEIRLHKHVISMKETHDYVLWNGQAPCKPLPIMLGKVPGEPIMGSPGDTPKVKDPTYLFCPFSGPARWQKLPGKETASAGRLGLQNLLFLK